MKEFWSKKYKNITCCLVCGTTESKHRCKGMCVRCQSRILAKQRVLRNKTNLDYIIMKKYGYMTRRSKKKNFTEICTKEEFQKFARDSEKLKELIKNWIDSDFDRKEIPTIDRIDNDKPYVIGNLQFITYRENTIKGNIEVPRYKRVKLLKDDLEFVFNGYANVAGFLNVKLQVINCAIKKGNTIKGWKIIIDEKNEVLEQEL